ncbi:MAG: hypothetical protein IJA49_07130 [Oscillospiraceae bacterium]|nr:hypothetical protein [Oscillospiraceae bacterium]
MDEQNLNEQELESPVLEETPEIPVPDMPEIPAPEAPSPGEIDETKPIVPRPKRRKSRQQLFKETYLPFVILGVSVLLSLSFIFGSVGLARERAELKAREERIAELMKNEAETLKSRAAAMAAEYDYENAMKTLANYSGGLAGNQELLNLYNGYKEALNDLVVWDDLSKIPHLSFRTLVTDLEKAAADPDRGSRYKKNYITTEEFSRILNQLYENGYVLVSLSDFAEPATAEDGSVTVTSTSIRLPEGKKPIILTSEGENYYSHTEGCGGFANALTVNSAGKLVCVDTDGNEGAFGFVPVLNAFLAEHPDFSYEGARATIALSGYDGLFGHSLEQTDAIKAVSDELRSQGYDIACYTYSDMEYADYGVAGLKEDMDKWFAEVTPVLGETDILVYPTGGDIKGQEAYSGSKYDALHGYGFRYFVGTGSGASWGMTAPEYARHIRTIVSAVNLQQHPDWFAGLFDAATVLSTERG